MDMSVIYFLLLLLGFLCFVADAVGVGPGRIRLLGAGLALWILVPLIHAAQRL